MNLDELKKLIIEANKYSVWAKSSGFDYRSG